MTVRTDGMSQGDSICEMILYAQDNSLPSATSGRLLGSETQVWATWEAVVAMYAVWIGAGASYSGLEIWSGVW